tara:strand:- start:147 stop:419 length:273 start_codon:yes stop_codon:yes gene_type:complete
MTEEVKKEQGELLDLMQDVLSDHSVPRNVRGIVEEAIQKVSGKELKIEGLSTAVYMMDDISKDLNLPSHTRTDIWEIISRMESIKEKIKD